MACALSDLLFRRDSFVPAGGARPRLFWSARWKRAGATSAGSRKTSRGSCSSAPFPSLAQALADGGGRDLAQVRQAALVLLYRLLFLLYAEDRGLLPVNDTRYEDYGLRTPVRDHVARRMDQGRCRFRTVATSYYDHVMTLCELIDRRRLLHRPAALQRRPIRGGRRSPARSRPPARLGHRPDNPRPEPHRDRRPAPLRQLPRHVRPAARLDLRAAARTRAGPR